MRSGAQHHAQVRGRAQRFGLLLLCWLAVAHQEPLLLNLPTALGGEMAHACEILSRKSTFCT